MAIHRYWRIVGIRTPSNTDLELSEFRFYNLGALADTECTITSTIAPFSGNLSYLTDNSSTNVILWEYSSWSQSGFSIKYDFGSGQGVEYPKFRIGSGSSQSTWIIDCVTQWSDDNMNWTGYFGLNNIHYPGAYSLTALPDSGSVDTSCVLLLNGSSLFDSSQYNQTISNFGSVQSSVAQSKYGGSSLYFTGSNRLDVTGDSIILNTDDFCIEFWVRFDSIGAFRRLITSTTGGFSANTVVVRLNSNNTLFAYAGGPAGIVSAAVSTGIWYHVATTRQSGTLRLFLNGVLQGSEYSANSTTESIKHIGGYYSLNNGEYHLGYIDGLRITKGVARYTANFTPPTSELSSLYQITLDQYTARLTKLSSLPNRILPVIELPNGTGYSVQKEYTFNDVYYGGSGIISGTTKIKNTLSNIPVMKRVVLIDERSKVTVAERWSNSATGYFEFKGIRTDILYTLLSYDHTGAFNAVVAVSVTPTIIS